MIRRSIFFLIFFFCACGRQQNIPENSVAVGDVPLQEFTGATSLIMADSGKTEWILRTTHMTKKRIEGKAIAEPVEFDYYGGKKDPLSHLTAKRGETTGQNFESLYVEGDVKVSSNKGYRLQAQNLRWNKKTNRITTNDRVHFTTRQGDLLTGVGFVSDPDLENWKILKDVKGEFQHFEKRMDDGAL